MRQYYESPGVTHDGGNKVCSNTSQRAIHTVPADIHAVGRFVANAKSRLIGPARLEQETRQVPSSPLTHLLTVGARIKRNFFSLLCIHSPGLKQCGPGRRGNRPVFFRRWGGCRSLTDPGRLHGLFDFFSPTEHTKLCMACMRFRWCCVCCVRKDKYSARGGQSAHAYTHTHTHLEPTNRNRSQAPRIASNCI